jgi:N6-adenosine-specific RNA methylase IME4
LNPPYRTIVADPPWPDEHKLTGVTRVGRVKKERGIDAQYSTLSMDDIAALAVADLAADDAHLYLWTTNLHLRQTFNVMDAWGFSFRTVLTWCKTGHLGLGHYFRTNTEHVLFGVRGSLRTEDRCQGTWFQAPKRGHSVKPPQFADVVERTSPGPYVELFARQPRLGWDHWGYGYEAERVGSLIERCEL